MPFRLSRGGKNVPAEVQRWQYFLQKKGFTQVGKIDGDFGEKTEKATKFFQVDKQLAATGKLDKATLEAARVSGYTVLADNYYRDRSSPEWPKKPEGAASPTNAWRNRQFKCFKFTQLARQFRPHAESIVIGGSCDNKIEDWVKEYIVDIEVKQLRFALGYRGYVRCHRFAAEFIAALFEAWEKADLLHLLVVYEGCFVPRYKRKQSPGDEPQPERRSVDVDQLSNHSFGSAMDLNYEQNQFPAQPALCGEFGSTRELVAVAWALGFYWGGFFKDGNHFELARISKKGHKRWRLNPTSRRLLA
jgi:Putative peptidoglycan binding domain/D-alanyl-D-alanine carboxypeptidase